MTAIRRRSMTSLVSQLNALATANDLDGVADATQSYDVTGVQRLIILQVNDGTAGTAGIDIVEYSKDGGSTWAAATDVLAVNSDDTTGTVLAAGAMNAAGVEPTAYAAFKCGPFEGPTAVRVSRGAQGTGTAWVTGAPSVTCFAVGGSHNGATLTALA